MCAEGTVREMLAEVEQQELYSRVITVRVIFQRYKSKNKSDVCRGTRVRIRVMSVEVQE